MDPKNITSQQKELLKGLAANKDNFTYEWDEIRGVLSFVRADELSSASSASAKTTNSDQKTLAEFLKVYAPLFGPTNLTDGLDLIFEKQDNLRWKHYQFQSSYTTGREKK